jgi:integrase
MNALDRLREELADVDLEPHVAIWQERIAGNVAPDTVRHYRHFVRSLIPEGVPFWRSAFTADRLDAWLSAYPGARNTRRKARAGMSQFCAYLVRAKVLKHNPVRDVEAPPLGPPRLRYLDSREMLRLANSQAEDMGVLSALLGGSGIEVSTALRLTRRDVDMERREIRAAGTKTHTRDRIVRVAEWAWPYVRDHADPLRPGDLLFPDITANQAGDSHRTACKRLGIPDYRLHDQRHSYAVRAARAGTPAELISRQLGHANAIMVLRIYGRFMPSQQERDRWELIAAAQDQESALRGTSQGTSLAPDSGDLAANLSSGKGLQAPIPLRQPGMTGNPHAPEQPSSPACGGRSRTIESLPH